MKGVDVSFSHVVRGWCERRRAEGYRVFVQALWAGGYANKLPHAEANLRAAREAGMICAGYLNTNPWFPAATSVAEAKKNAGAEWANLGVVFNDIEIAGVTEAQCKAHCEAIVAEGKDTAIYCVAPETRVLTHDLRWVPAEELTVGDPLLAFDESPERRGRGHSYQGYKPALVTGAELRKLNCYDIYLETGERLRSSAEHMWLVAPKNYWRRWLRTDEFPASMERTTRKHPLKMCRFLPVWTTETSYDAGFLAAAFDGEGCLGSGTRLSFAQKPNAFLEAVNQALDREGFAFNQHLNKWSGTVATQLNGGLREVARFLGSYRPPRLLDKWGQAEMPLPQLRAFEWVGVDRVEFVGEQSVAAISTTARTYLAEGFGAHNSAAWFWGTDGPPARAGVLGNPKWPWLSAFDIWVADYDNDPSFSTATLFGPWGLADVIGKQYTNTTLLDGVNVDLNEFADEFFEEDDMGLTVEEHDWLLLAVQSAQRADVELDSVAVELAAIKALCGSDDPAMEGLTAAQLAAISKAVADEIAKRAKD